MSDSQEMAIPSLTKASVLIRESIFLGSVSSRAQRPSFHIFSAERAQWWIHAANNAVLEPCRTIPRDCATSTFDMIAAIIVVVVVFCEIPASRSSIVRSVLQVVSADNSLSKDVTPKLLYCEVLAIIARSLARNDDAFGATGLSALNPVANVFAQPISKPVFCSLAMSLAPLSSARVSLLSFARKSLDAAPWSYDHYFLWADGGGCERRDRIECGFFALCAILAHGSLSDECGLEAWKMLSDFIVLRRPSLPCAARTVLFECLFTFVRLNRFSVMFCQHLLRACLVTLLMYCFDSGGHLEIILDRAFSTWANTKPTSTTRIVQKEDLVSVFRLTFALLHRTSLDDEKQSQAIKRERASLINNILALRNNETREGFSSVELDDRETLSSVASVWLVDSLLTTIIKERSTVSEDLPTPENRESILRKLMTMLLKAERDELISIDLDSTVENQLPGWLHNFSETGAMLPRAPPIDSSILAPIQLSLIDMLLEFVTGPNWPSTESNELECGSEDERERNILACGFIFSLKSSRRKLLGKSGEVDANKAFDDETFCFFARSCLKSSALFLKSGKEMPSDAETVLELSLEICESIHDMLSGSDLTCRRNNSDLPDLFRCVWELYLVVGTEEGACRFVEYFDEACSKQKNCTSKTARLCFGRVKTTKDVDEMMRTIRTTILFALLPFTTLTTMNRLGPMVGLPALLGDGLNEKEFGTMKSETLGFSADFLCTVLVVLCNDLRSSLEGKSGGMTSHSFLTYVDCIEGVADMIRNHVATRTQLNCAASALTACSQGSSLIEEILCSFPLRAVALFKRSLKLALIKLPSLARFIRREQTVGFVDVIRVECCATYVFANNVFVQCVNVHVRWAAEGMNSTTPWSEVAGPEHCLSDEVDLPGEEGTPYPQSALSCDDVPTVITVPIERKGAASLETKWQRAGGKIQLPVKESWSWACVFSLTAMEENWIESMKVMMLRNHATVPSTTSITGLASYLAARREELGSILHTLRFAFEQAELAAESWKLTKSRKDSSERILVMLMPNAVKIRICSLIGRISTVLRRSVKIMLSFNRGSIATMTCDEGAILNLETVEALACLSSWLFDKLDESDILTLTRKWYHAEKHMHEASQKSNSFDPGEDPILRRFPKLLRQVEELESATQTLSQLVCSMKDDDVSEKIRAIDGLLKNSWEPSWDYDAQDNNITIGGLLSRKVKAISKSRSKYTIGAELLEEPTTTSNRKRRKEIMRVHRRRVVRSRNEVVDKWLQWDQEFGDEGVDDDAYVELEDFLVDG